MKNLLVLFLGVFLALNVQSQVPQSFSYQAVLRDNSNVVLANQNVNIKIMILEGSTAGTVVYSETHNVITNDLGLVNLQIGSGTVVTGVFTSINWGSATKFVRVELDPTGGSSFTFMGTSQLLSVPYALYAESSGTGGSSYTAGTGINITGTVITNTSPNIPVSLVGAGSTSVTGSYPNFTITSNDGDTTLWKVNGSNIYRKYNNVGIGVANPFYKLTMNDTLSISKVNSFYSVTQGGSTAGTTFRGGNFQIYGTNGINRGIQGYSGGISTEANQGVTGFADNSTTENHGVLGAAYGSATISAGVYGYSSGSGDYVRGVLGYVTGTGISNVGGEFSSDGVGNGSEGNVGVLGIAANNPLGNFGVYGSTNGLGTPGDYAGYFYGDVTITGNLNVSGNLSKGGGTFKIDHPLDPANKYLVHSFVESPEMLNVYSGNITTDSNGLATVILPEYFDAANKDVRYQLTAIGTFSQAIIQEEVNGNQFVIATSSPNVKVSWQITSVRDDQYANANRVIPELEKTEPGTYLHPELFGQDSTKSENYKYLIKPITQSENLPGLLPTQK